jgi:DNA-binding NarL/FixJ family response regulator
MPTTEGSTPAPDPLLISPATSKTHVSRIMSKLEALDRAQLVVIAYEIGLFTVA